MFGVGRKIGQFINSEHVLFIFSTLSFRIIQSLDGRKASLHKNYNKKIGL